MSLPGLSQEELNVLSGVFHKSCSHTYKELISNKRKNGAFPSNKEANVKMIECYSKTLVKANEHCGEALKAIKKCISARDPPVLKCAELQGQFEKCYESKALAP